MDEPGVAVKGEDDGLVGREKSVEIAIGKTVRVLARRLQSHQVYDIDDADLQFGGMMPDQLDGGKGFQRRHVAAARHHHVGLLAAVVARPFPDSQSGLAVLDRLVHRQPLRRRLLASDNDVDVVAAPQAVIGHREQAIGVRRQIDADNVGLLVDDVIDEPGILMAESVVVLSPNVAREEIVQRTDRPSPGNMVATFSHFAC
jgi:hypothetical protein